MTNAMNNNKQLPSIKNLFKPKGMETFASRLHHFIGCWFVGSPQELNVPEDFWYDDDCRTPPQPADYDRSGVAGELLEVETFRRSLRWKLARVAPIFFFIACSGVWLTSLTLGAGIEKTKSVANEISVKIKADTEVSTDDMRDLTNDQIVEELKNSLSVRGVTVKQIDKKEVEPSPRESSLIAEMKKRGIRPEELL